MSAEVIRCVSRSETSSRTDAVGNEHHASIRKRINIIGDVFCDILAAHIGGLPKWGEDVLGDISLVPGGGALNCISHAAKWACYTAGNVHRPHINFCNSNNEATVCLGLYSIIGNDAQGLICKSHLASLDGDIVQDCCISREDLGTGTCIVLSGSDDRCFVTDRGAIGKLELSLFERGSLLRASHIHIAGYYNLTMICRDPQPLFNLLSQARQNGVTTSFNPQHDAIGLWGGIALLAPVLDLIICNSEELLRMAPDPARGGVTKQQQLEQQEGLHREQSSSSEDGSAESATTATTTTAAAAAAAAATSLLKSGVKYVVVTSAEKGVTVFTLTASLNRIEDNDVINECIPSTRALGYNEAIVSNVLHLSATNSSSEDVLTVYLPAVPLGDRVLLDATGAGDAFSGAFLVQFVSMQGYPQTDTNDADRSQQQLAAVICGAAAGCKAGAAAVTVASGSSTSYEYF